MTWKHGFALLLTFFLTGRGTGPVMADGPLGNDRFGLCFVSAAESLSDETRYDGALASGAKWDRWPLYWHWVDEGGYAGYHDGSVPHDYDTLVLQEIQHGLTPIAILLGTPDMRATAGDASAPPPRVRDKIFPVPGQVAIQQGQVSTAASPPVGLFEPIFADGTNTPGPGKVINQGNTWAVFVANTVDRYKPGSDWLKSQGWDDVGIRHWEIWNEQDLNQFWSGTVAEYYRLLEVAYQTIKSADSEATVILGALAFFEKPNWLSDLLAQTEGDPSKAYFDVFSFHYYWSIYHGEYWLAQTRATLDANGLPGVPIWITESGVPVWDDYPATEYEVPSDSPWRGTMEEQAAYVIQNAALAFYHDVARYYHFMLHDDCGNTPQDAFGLRQNFTPADCNPAQGKTRPSYAAFQLAAEQYRDPIALWRRKSGGQDQIAFYREDDTSRLLALWATGGVTVTATVSATGQTAQLYWVEPTSSPSGTTGISRTLTLTPTNGVYTLTLPAATNQNSGLPGDSNYYIGGRPYLLVERDTLPPTSGVTSLPLTTTQESFTVSWQGEDAGSGITGYDVWFSEDGGPLQPWITDTMTTSAGFTGVFSHTYGFAVRARDRAGNEEPIPSVPQASTFVEPDTAPPTSSVEPLPEKSGETFVVRWQGQDAASGVANYDVWFNDDGGPLQLWITETAATSASFTGIVSHTYGFAVRARDNVGNEEPMPTAPQASTLVVPGVSVSGVVLGADGGAVVSATVTIRGPSALQTVVTTSNGGFWSAGALPLGEYAFYATAPGHDRWPAPRHLTISDLTSITLTLALPFNAVVVGDFEGGDVWSAWERPNGDVTLSTEAFDGQTAALLGSGTGQSVPCLQKGPEAVGELWTLKQSVWVSSGTAPTLSFLHAISTTQTAFDYAWLEVVLVADGQAHYLVPWGNLWDTSDWTLDALDLSPWRGETVDLLFQAVNCSEDFFTVTLDRVSVGDAAAVELTERVYLPLVLR